jgi:hypothetical protein
MEDTPAFERLRDLGIVHGGLLSGDDGLWAFALIIVSKVPPGHDFQRRL